MGAWGQLVEGVAPGGASEDSCLIVMDVVETVVSSGAARLHAQQVERCLSDPCV